MRPFFCFGLCSSLLASFFPFFSFLFWVGIELLFVVIGWSTRLADSIYAGCIPVLIGDSSHYPFFDVIDWGKISVRVDINDLSHLEEHLLSRYTLEDIERLQTNVMLVRNAFLYPLDTTTPEDAQKHMLDERGPLYFALLSTKMKLLTEWPIAEAYDRP